MTFRIGDRVQTSARNPPGHNRLPRYLRAKPGLIEAVHDLYPLPDAAARGAVVPERLYTVVFSAGDIWDVDAEPNCRIHAELWESYLAHR